MDSHPTQHTGTLLPSSAASAAGNEGFGGGLWVTVAPAIR